MKFSGEREREWKNNKGFRSSVKNDQYIFMVISCIGDRAVFRHFYTNKKINIFKERKRGKEFA